MLSLIMLFEFYRTCSGEEYCYRFRSGTIDTVIWSQPLPFPFHFRSDTIVQFFPDKSKIQQFCDYFQLFEIVYLTDFSEAVVVQFQHSQVCVLENEGPLCSSCALKNSSSYNELFLWSSFLNILLLLALKDFFVTEVLYHSVLAPLQDLELLARSFIVSVTALECGFSSPCYFASIVDLTKLLKHFFWVFSTKRCILMQTIFKSR